MTIEQLKARKKEILTELENSDITEARVKELEAERITIDATVSAIESIAEERKAEERKAIEFGTPVPNFAAAPGDGKSRKVTADSEEYRDIFVKLLMRKAVTAEERKAFDAVQSERSTFTGTTENQAAVVPTLLLDEIWSYIGQKHSILEDITVIRSNTIISIPVHTAIVQGGADVVNEGEANDDEENTLISVTLSGKDFSKHIEISYALANMSVKAYTDYLIREIGDEISGKMANDVVTTITSGINASNKIETASAGTIVWADVTSVAALVEHSSELKWYANRQTIYGKIAGMVDNNNRPIFQTTAQAGIEGYLLGGEVKVEESVGDGKILVGGPKNVVMNVIQDILIERDKDIKKHVEIISGYARAESALLWSKSFGLLTVKNS